jgi:hypothetical protein
MTLITGLIAPMAMALPVSAQEQDGTVTGQVVALETGQGLSTFNVQLLALPDSSQVRGVATAFDGRFSLSGLAPGRYFLSVQGLGYGTRETEPFEVEGGVVYDFGTIEVSVDAVLLDPISIVSERPAVSYEADRTSYLVDAMAGTAGGSITDALRAVPGLDVDIDGNIEVRGERPSIWLDGRPAPLSGASLDQFLEQFPADLVDRIEVIDAPGAEYDAEGPGGIVNIVLKEGVDLGISGNVFANAGTRGNSGVGTRLTMQRGDWVLNTNTSLRRNDSEVESWNWRQNLAANPSDIVERGSWNTNQSLGGNVGLRATWTPREEARWNLRLDAGGQGRDQDGLVTTTHRDPFEVATGRFERSDLAESGDGSFSLRTDFQWRWEPRRHELEAELRYGQGSDHRESVEEILSDEELADQIAFVPAEITLDDRESSEREFRFDVDYRRPMGESGSIRTGFSFRSDRNNNARTLTYIHDAFQEGESDVELRGYGRDQRMASGYLTLQGNLFDGVSLQAGVRAEQVLWDLDFPDMDSFSRRYFDLFPSVNLSWRPDSARRIRLSYSQRVGRPGVSVLDPTDRSTDPLERNVGNPDIGPRTTHRFNLDASWNLDLGTLSVGPYLNRTVDGWERVSTVDADGVTTRSWENMSSQTSVGGSINFSFRGWGSWRGTANVSASRSWRDAEGLRPTFSRSSTSWNSRLNLNGSLVGELTMQTSLRYRAAGRSLQGRDGSQVTTDVSFRYRFMERRASASLSIRDPFGLQRSESEILSADLWEIRESSRDSRSLRLSLSYSFGGGGGGGGGRGGR